MAPPCRAPRRKLAPPVAPPWRASRLPRCPASALAGATRARQPRPPRTPRTPRPPTSVMVVLATVIALAMIVGLLAAVRGRGKARRAGRNAADPRHERRSSAASASALGVLALAVFVFGIVVTESARKVEATGADGLTTAQKDLKPARRRQQAARDHTSPASSGCGATSTRTAPSATTRWSSRSIPR